MKSQDVTKLIAIYIVSIGDGVPNGHLFAANMNEVDLERHNAILHVLKQNGLVKEFNYYLTLTDKGREMWTKLAKILTRSAPSETNAPAEGI